MPPDDIIKGMTFKGLPAGADQKIKDALKKVLEEEVLNKGGAQAWFASGSIMG